MTGAIAHESLAIYPTAPNNHLAGTCCNAPIMHYFWLIAGIAGDHFNNHRSRLMQHSHNWLIGIIKDNKLKAAV